MESLHSKVVKVLLWLIRYKRPMQLSGDELREHVQKKRIKECHEAPRKLDRKYQIDKIQIKGSCCYIMKSRKKAGTKHILYFHGGGYVYELSRLHWDFLAKLTDMLQCTITIPIYPLAPEHLCDETYDMLLSLYCKIISEVDPKNLTIMGDSSGGAMSLALAQLLKEKQLPQPDNIILISPSLDYSLTNPEIPEVERIDPLLSAPAIIEFGHWFGGDKGSKHHLVSPIYGNMEGLGKISLFIGTHDLQYPDARRFKRLADEKEIEINYFEYPKMIHDWPLLTFPESKKAREQIMNIIK